MVAVEAEVFAVLGLKPGCEEKDVKRAYRHLAMKYHPDRNPGDKEAELKFKAIQEAYDLIMGRKDVNPPDQTRAHVIEVISQCLGTVVSAIINSGRTPKSEDLIREVRTALNTARSNISSARKDLEKAKTQLESLKGRFESTNANAQTSDELASGPELMEGIVEGHIKSIDKQMGAFQQQLLINSKALDGLHERIVVVANVFEDHLELDSTTEH